MTQRQSIDSRPFTSVWSDLQEVEFSQGFLQAGPYRTRYLHAGDDLEAGAADAARHHRPRRGLRAQPGRARRALLGAGRSTSSATATPASPTTRWRSRTTSTRSPTSSTPSGAEKAYFTGESLGGWVTARYAQTHPERVERIVLNTMGGTMANPKVMERLYTLSMEAAKDPSWERVKARLEWLMADPAMVTDDLIRTRQAIFQQHGLAQGVRGEHGSAGPRDPQAQHDHRRRPAGHSGAGAGAVDHQGPLRPGRRGPRIASLIPDAQLAVMDNCGHWPQYEDTETFNKIHLDFLLGR